MGIEPLGSMMTAQAQSVQKQAVTKQAESKQAENKEVFTSEQAVSADTKTVSIVKMNGKEEQNNENTEGNEQQASNERIKKAVEQLNKNMKHSEAIFGVHDETNRVTIKIIDRDTKEVLKELPPEKTLDMIAKVWELAGILVDEKR